jgi:hypothetical protein
MQPPAGPTSFKGESMGVKTAQAIWSERRSSQLERASISHPA